MRVVVTGGAGFIGRHLVRNLVESSYSVRVIDNFMRGTRAALDGIDVEIIEGDIRDVGLVRFALEGADIVYHLAAQSNVIGADANMEYAVSTNVTGTVNTLHAAREAGVRRVVFTSSREVYGDVAELPVPETTPLRPKNIYGASKASGEMYCRAFARRDFAIVILRLANVYGPSDRDRVIPLFLSRALAGRPLTIYGRNKLLDFVWIDDVVKCLVRAASCPPSEEAINVGSGKSVDLDVLADRIISLAGSSSVVEYAPGRSIEVDRFTADIQRAQNLLRHSSPADPLAHLADLI